MNQNLLPLSELAQDELRALSNIASNPDFYKVLTLMVERYTIGWQTSLPSDAATREAYYFKMQSINELGMFVRNHAQRTTSR